MRPGTPVAILGAGSWGTTLAWLLARQGVAVHLWCRDPDRAAEIARSRRNDRYLSTLELPAEITISADLPGLLKDARLVVLAVPSQAARSVLEQAAPHRPTRAPMLLASKGLELTSGRRMSEVAVETLGDEVGDRLAVLSGPNLSAEIVAGLPATTVIASTNEALRRDLQQLFSSERFRVYTNSDVIGVELGEALKNPIAIAAGICDGLGGGDNSKAALVTRGLAEMTRLAVAAGARATTLSGLSGLGDLIATAYGDSSRNHQLGRALGRGQDLAAAQAALGQVAEGVPTTAAAVALAKQLGVDLPLTAVLRQVLFEGKPIADAIPALLRRELRSEGDVSP